MTENLNSKIAKPWAVYGYGLGQTDLARVVSLSEDEKTGYLQYSERQNYSPECWDMSYVKTFETSIEAVKYFFENQCPLWETRLSLTDIDNILLNSFPKALKQESIQKLHDTLVAYQYL